MKPSLWRAIALLFIATGIAFVCYQLTTPDRDEFGLSYIVPARAPGTIQITDVAPNSPAANAGIRKNDLISYGNTALQRADARYAPAGSTVRLTINGTRTVQLTARHMRAIAYAIWPVTLIRLAFLAVAALLAWRRPEDPAARALAVFLWCYGLAISLNSGILPNPVLSLIFLQVAQGVLFVIGTAAAAVFAARFPSPSTRFAPRIMAQTAEVVAVLAACAVVAGNFLARSASGVSLINAGVLVGFAIIGAMVIATLVVTYVQSGPDERQRRQWVFLFVGLGLLGPTIDIAVQAVFGLQPWVDDLTLLPLAIMPIGLAYVILRHRVIDVGFVLNRAVVYTGVSVVIVAVFVIVETLLSKYVEQTSHAGSVAVQLVVALILGFSIRAIHARVDRFVDTVFFRERHEAETAMREFAFDAPYITDSRILLRRCVEIVERYAHASNAGVWLRNQTAYEQAEGTFKHTGIGENDPAVVAMRARRVVAEIQNLHSALPGTLAFPMIVRGQLIGMLLCGPKTEDETYAPDERDALSAVAIAVGHALDGLRVAELEQTVEQLLTGRPGGATQGAMGTF